MRPATIMALIVMAAMSVACAASSEEETAPVEVKVETESTSEPAYGSTFASNCYCLACTRYCTVDGTTYKSGTCC